MTSRIIVNQIEADAGINTVTFNDTISGNLIGNVTGNITGNTSVSGIITATGTSNSITINPDLEYPSIRPTLDLNFAATKTLDRRITFTRDSLGTYTDELGIVRTVPNNTPRFDHDPTTGESLGLLIEESRTNYTYNSLNYSGSWTLNRATFTGITTVTAPDGTTDGVVLFAENTETGPHHFKSPANTTTETIADGTTVTSSIWVKKYGSKQYITFGLNTKDDTPAGGDYPLVTVDLDTGTVSNIPANYTATSTAYPNGWYRITVTGDGGTGSARTAPVNSLFLVQNGSSTVSSYTGDGSSGVYVWGPQMEIGSFATSFIPTTDANTVTRAADYAKITGTNFTDFYNSKESAITVRFNMYGYTGSGFNRVYEISDGTTDNRHSVLTNGTNSEIYETFNISSSNELPYNPKTITFGNFYNYTESFKNNDYQRYLNVNGTLEENTDSSISIDNFPATQIIFGGHLNSSSAGILNGHISYFKYYNKRLPNAQLQGLTAQ